MNTQPKSHSDVEALQYAKWLDCNATILTMTTRSKMAAELRRLHAENKDISETSSQVIADNVRLHEEKAYFQESYGQELRTSNELRVLNAELLEALKYVIDAWVEGNGSEWNQSDSAAKACAAISRAESTLKTE